MHVFVFLFTWMIELLIGLEKAVAINQKDVCDMHTHPDDEKGFKGFHRGRVRIQ